MVEITKKNPQRFRFDFLSEWLQENGVDFEFDYIQSQDLESDIQEAKKEFDSIRFGPSCIDEAARLQSRLPASAQIIMSIEALMRERKQWWPRSFCGDAIRQVFVERVQSLDTLRSAVIVGSGGLARIAAQFAVTSGYKKILFSGIESDKGTALVSDLSRVFFDCHLEWMGDRVLGLSPGSTSLLINTEPIVSDSDLFSDLCYFNFLHNKGVVCELLASNFNAQLVREARNVNIQCVTGELIASREDSLWIKKAVPSHMFKEKEYTEAWIEFLQNSV